MKGSLPQLTIARVEASDPDIRALLADHEALMRGSSPAESCHVMAPEDLAGAGAVILGARLSGDIVGVGALKRILPREGEIKSMHTRATARGAGIGRAVLLALLDEARRLGLKRVSLETGSSALFAPARALYVSEGFVPCAPFAAYSEDPESAFFTRQI